MIYIIEDFVIKPVKEYDILTVVKNGSTICVDDEGKTAQFQKDVLISDSYEVAKNKLMDLVNSTIADKLVEIDNLRELYNKLDNEVLEK